MTSELLPVLNELHVRLIESRQTVSVAESCTGGLLGAALTECSGSSAYFLGGVQAYANSVKEELLGVSHETLLSFGAVSEEVASEMALGIQRLTGSDWALSTTGIAGPDGGTDEKPVGTVCLAVAGPSSETVVTRFNPFDRETFKWVTGQQLLDLLRLELMP